MILPKRTLAKQASCPGFVEGKGTVPAEVDRFYANRAVSIVRAGLDADEAALGALVSPDATFETWRGDYTSGSRQGGATGAVIWSRDLNSTNFETLIDRRGLISVTPLKCEWSATVLFRTQQAETGVRATFKFVDGMLIQTVGHEVVLIEGKVR